MNIEPEQHEPGHERHFEEGEEAPPPGARAMALVRWLLVLAMAAAATLSILHVYGQPEPAADHTRALYYCPMHPSVVQDHPGECPICSMTLVRKEPATAPVAAPAPATSHAGHRHEPSDPYLCPMHPEESGVDASARCPLCGMALVKRPDGGAPHAAATHDGAVPPAHPHAATPIASAPTTAPPTVEPGVAGLRAVELPPQRLQLIGMRSAQVTRAALPSQLDGVGYVVAPESGLSVVQTRFAGWIEELHVAETGQLVQRGQLLARVYSPELLAAQQELLNAKRWNEGERGALAESARQRLELLGMQPTEIEAVERAGTPHRLVEIRAPARGYVAQKSAVQGLYIQPGTRLFDIADLSKVWVWVELSERDAGSVRQGQRASLRLNAYPGEVFHGKVQLVYPTLNVDTRTQRARIEFANRDLRLRPGMFGDVQIEQAEAHGLLIPNEAVVDTGEQQYVYVVEQAGRFVPRSVRLGARTGAQVQVLSGLREGETVVTTGNFLIDSESRLRSAIEGGAGGRHRH